MARQLMIWACVLGTCGCLLMTASMFIRMFQLHHHQGPLDSPGAKAHANEVRRRERRPPPVRAQAADAAPKRPASSSAAATAKVAPKQQDRDSSPVIAQKADTARSAQSGNDTEASEDELLARARARRGRFLKVFEAAVKSGLVKELMHDPYPPPDDKAESQPRHGSRHGEHHHSKSTWEWMFGQNSKEDSSQEVTEYTARDKEKPQKSNVADVTCLFEQGVDYIGQDVGTVEGLSEQGCCELCASKKSSCTVAVMSSSYDEPPNACWLKTRVSKEVKKKGVRACWPQGNQQAFQDSATEDV